MFRDSIVIQTKLNINGIPIFSRLHGGLIITWKMVRDI